MKDDPVIQRIREARHQISAECGHDPRRLAEYYMKLQEQNRGRFFRRGAPSQRAKAA
ncbi:MAG: hypothetical protein HY321_15135 [Armatimonadetes bacterium]|nr:hypothetical protein [Armatimonadota bacterium]